MLRGSGASSTCRMVHYWPCCCCCTKWGEKRKKAIAILVVHKAEPLPGLPGDLGPVLALLPTCHLTMTRGPPSLLLLPSEMDLPALFSLSSKETAHSPPLILPHPHLDPFPWSDPGVEWPSVSPCLFHSLRAWLSSSRSSLSGASRWKRTRRSCNWASRAPPR